MLLYKISKRHAIFLNIFRTIFLLFFQKHRHGRKYVDLSQKIDQMKTVFSFPNPEIEF
jgi:hypothetical protein